MKQWILFLWFAGLACLAGSMGSASAQGTGFSLAGVGSAVVPVTLDKMTNIIFPQRVLTGVKVSRDVLVQKVKGVENVIELKAMRRGFPETNLSVYGRDGRLYSFVLRYSEDTAVLNYRVVAAGAPASDGLVSLGGLAEPAVIQLTGLPVDEVRLEEDADSLAARRFFLRRVARSGGVRLRLGGVYVKDSLLWLAFSVRDNSPLGFGEVRWRFYLQEVRQVRRRAEQEVEVIPVAGPRLGFVAGQGDRRVAVGFRPFSVPAGMRLVVAVTGEDGRGVVLHLNKGVITRAHDGL